MEYAGMGHHAEGGLVAHIGRVARSGCVVHADCALGPFDLRTQLGAQQVAGAGDNHTLAAPGGQRLVAKNGDVSVSDAPLPEVDRPACPAPQGAIMKDLIGTAGAVEDEDGDEGKEDHEHC